MTTTKLSDRYFGDVEAFDEAEQNPDFFNKTFVMPSSIDTGMLSNRNKFIIVGRKGVGKSAIKMNFANTLRSRGFFVHHFRFFYDVRSDDFTAVSQTQSEISFTSIVKGADLFLHYDFRDVWERVIHQRIADTLVENGISNAFTDFCIDKPSFLRDLFSGISKALTISVSANMGSAVASIGLDVTSRKVIWLFLEQFWLEFVPVLHRLQGRLAAQG